MVSAFILFLGSKDHRFAVDVFDTGDGEFLLEVSGHDGYFGVAIPSFELFEEFVDSHGVWFLMCEGRLAGKYAGYNAARMEHAALVRGHFRRRCG